MPAVLSYRKDQRRLAGPTEAFTVKPEGLTVVPPSSILDIDDDGTVSGVTAVVDQARALVSRHPKSAIAKARLAQAELASDRPDDARRTALQVASMTAGSPQREATSVAVAAQILAATGDSAAAEAALSSLGQEWFPHLFAQFAVERGDWDLALSRLDGLTDLVSRDLTGWVFLQQHRYSDAVACLRAAIRDSGPTPASYLNLGYAYGALGSPKKAIRATAAAYQMVPASRTAAFNLASFHASSGDRAAAMTVLQRIRQFHPDALSVRLATASVLARFGEFERAERELQRAQAERVGWAAGSGERAVLRADLVAVQHAMGKVPSGDAFDRVLKVLRSIDYSDLTIARLLVGWMTSSKDADRSAALLSELGRRHPSTSLGAFKTRDALLRRNFPEALLHAREWAEHDPFDAAAPMMLAYLLSEVEHSYGEVIRVCREALRRTPSEPVLRNNLAYALAMSGDLESAQKELSLIGGDSDPVCKATAGLIEMRRGRIDAGISLYQEGIAQAEEMRFPDLADLIRQRLALEAQIVGRDVNIDLQALADRCSDDVRFAIAEQMTNASR